LGGEGYRHVGSFSLGNGTFDSNMIDLSIISSLLPLGVKISVGTSGDCEDCAIGGKSIDLLRRLTSLWRRWWRWIGFWVVLLASVA
jgi:hypothetical protein